MSDNKESDRVFDFPDPVMGQEPHMTYTSLAAQPISGGDTALAHLGLGDGAVLRMWFAFGVPITALDLVLAAGTLITAFTCCFIVYELWAGRRGYRKQQRTRQARPKGRGYRRAEVCDWPLERIDEELSDGDETSCSEP